MQLVCPRRPQFSCGGHAQVFGGRDEPLDPFFRVILTQGTAEHADLLSGDGFVWPEWGAKFIRYVSSRPLWLTAGLSAPPKLANTCGNASLEKARLVGLGHAGRLCAAHGASFLRLSWLGRAYG